MRTIYMLFTGFVMGFATAYAVMLFIGQDAILQAALDRQEARIEALESAQTAPAPATGGDERLAIDERGHAQARAEIDGASFDVVIDTGASVVALRESDARRAGYRLSEADFTVPVRTANGIKHAAPITLRVVEVGSIRVRDVAALVSRDDQLSVNLLGMSFLQRLDGFRFDGRHLVLEN